MFDHVSMLQGEKIVADRYWCLKSVTYRLCRSAVTLLWPTLFVSGVRLGESPENVSGAISYVMYRMFTNKESVLVDLKAKRYNITFTSQAGLVCRLKLSTSFVRKGV